MSTSSGKAARWQSGKAAKELQFRFIPATRVWLIAGLLVSHSATLPLSPSLEAAVSRGTNKALDSGQANQGAEPSSSPTSGRSTQMSVGQPFATGKLSTTRFSMRPGFVEAVAAATKAKPPPSQLDITSLYAKTEPSGTNIAASTWQRDNDPVFIWQAPSAGLDIKGYSYSLNATPDTTVETSATSWNVADDVIKVLPDGMHTFSVSAVNTAGKQGAPASFVIWVDHSPPTISGTSPSAGTMLRTLSPSISASVVDPFSGITSTSVTLLVNGSPVTATVDKANGSISSTGRVLREGSNTIELRASDAVGNAATPLVWSVSADVTPPSGSVTINGGASMSTSAYVTLSLTATDAMTGVTRMQLSNDPAVGFVEEPFSTVRELWRLKAVRGSQRVYVKFVDGAGNVSEPVIDDIELGLLAPDTIIVSGPAGITPSRTATFTYSCPEGGCQFSYAFDKESWSPWSTETTATKAGLIYGNHYFAVKAAKETNGQAGIQADEEDPVPAERTWIVGVEPVRIFVPRGNSIKLWRIE